MPATERFFSDPPPSRLYLDTDLFLACLIDTRPHHLRCRTFLERLALQGRTELFVSSLTWLEFCHVVTREDFRQALSEPMRRRHQLDRWDDPAVREAYLDALVQAAEDILAPFPTAEIPLNSDVRIEASRLIVQYRLRSQDAAHVAAALLAGVPDVASLDEGFRRVDGIILWNDHIHGVH